MAIEDLSRCHWVGPYPAIWHKTGPDPMTERVSGIRIHIGGRHNLVDDGCSRYINNSGKKLRAKLMKICRGRLSSIVGMLITLVARRCLVSGNLWKNGRLYLFVGYNLHQFMRIYKAKRGLSEVEETAAMIICPSSCLSGPSTTLPGPAYSKQTLTTRGSQMYWQELFVPHDFYALCEGI